MASDCGLYDAVDVQRTVISRVVDPCRPNFVDVAVLRTRSGCFSNCCQPHAAGWLSSREAMLSEARNKELSSQKPSQVVVCASKCRCMETAEDMKPFEDSWDSWDRCRCLNWRLSSGLTRTAVIDQTTELRGCGSIRPFAAIAWWIRRV